MQETIYLKASIQFEQKQSKSMHKQGLFECRTAFGGKTLQNVNVKSMSHALKLTTLLNKDRKKASYSSTNYLATD